MYTLLYYGEEAGEYRDAEELRTEMRKIRESFISDEKYEMEHWPEDYTEGYQAGDGFEEHFRDAYEVYSAVDPTQFLQEIR